jgi:SPP1 gp7 family putative phage head morphogenesis protein
MDLPEETIQAIINGIWDKTISLYGLNKSKPVLKLYNAIASYLHKGIDKGFGKVSLSYDDPDYVMLKHLKQNVYLFDAAKTFNYVLSTKNLMIDEKGKLIPKKEYIQNALKLDEKFNKRWLDVEYNTAIARSQSARQEQYFQENKAFFPYIKWTTSGGETVCPICSPMDGITLPVDDPTWATHPYPAHFECNCKKVNVMKEEALVTDLRKVTLPVFPDGFKTNAINGELFDKSHPYFSVPDRYIKLAKKNFHLPIK